MKIIKVNMAQQTVAAFEANKQIFSFECVSGDHDHPTNKGTFQIVRKAHPYRSQKYNVQMNYAMFFTNDGKALHQYHGPIPLSVVRAMKQGVSDWFGSHGCVRLVEKDASALYSWARIGTKVHVI